jgi:hypothetical protein
MSGALLTTGKVYKVWIDIEEYDIEGGHGELLDMSIPCTGTYATEDEALAVAERMHSAFENEHGQIEHN